MSQMKRRAMGLIEVQISPDFEQDILTKLTELEQRVIALETSRQQNEPPTSEPVPTEPVPTSEPVPTEPVPSLVDSNESSAASKPKRKPRKKKIKMEDVQKKILAADRGYDKAVQFLKGKGRQKLSELSPDDLRTFVESLGE